MPIIKGKLDPFCETGTEGVVWCLYEDGKTGYDGLHLLMDNDYLAILDPNDNTKVIWEGHISLEYSTNCQPHPLNPNYMFQIIDGQGVKGIQVDIEPSVWFEWFQKQYPAELIKAAAGHMFH